MGFYGMDDLIVEADGDWGRGGDFDEILVSQAVNRACLSTRLLLGRCRIGVCVSEHKLLVYGPNAIACRLANMRWHRGDLAVMAGELGLKWVVIYFDGHSSLFFPARWLNR